MSIKLVFTTTIDTVRGQYEAADFKLRFTSSGICREKKKVLGLHGDTLPAMAMNTADGRVLTYDEPDFSELALESFVRRYLGMQLYSSQLLVVLLLATLLLFVTIGRPRYRPYFSGALPRLMLRRGRSREEERG